MIYPKFLEKDSCIGIVALSSGVGRKLESFDESLNCLRKEGYRIKESGEVRADNLRGGDAKSRARALYELYKDDDVDMIICASGGFFLYEVLPFIKKEGIMNNYKWFMGASDPTSICFMLTTKFDIATLYGLNAGSYYNDMDYIKNNLSIFKGDLVCQNSFDFFEDKDGFLKDGIYLTNNVFWDSYGDEIDVEGRCIGGCLDVLINLVGTDYHDIDLFLEKYKDDGIVWYFDIYSMSSENVYISLLQLKAAGWFKYAKGFIFGRVLFDSSLTELSYKEAYKMALPNEKIISDADIGHTLPKMTMINGAIINVKSSDGKGEIRFKLV